MPFFARARIHRVSVSIPARRSTPPPASADGLRKRPSGRVAGLRRADEDVQIVVPAEAEPRGSRDRAATPDRRLPAQQRVAVLQRCPAVRAAVHLVALSRSRRKSGASPTKMRTPRSHTVRLVAEGPRFVRRPQYGPADMAVAYPGPPGPGTQPCRPGPAAGRLREHGFHGHRSGRRGPRHAGSAAPRNARAPRSRVVSFRCPADPFSRSAASAGTAARVGRPAGVPPPRPGTAGRRPGGRRP